MEVSLRALHLVLFAVPLLAQRQAGELRLQVTDPAGMGLPARISILSQATDVRRTASADDGGRLVVRGLPFGPYRVHIDRPGFAPLSTLVEIRSEAPTERRLTLQVASVETALTVSDTGTLLDPERTGALFHAGPDTLAASPASSPARSVLELVNRHPGWLLEANGVLHPRGSEYDTQYVIDGIPVLDNRSPAFAPAFEAEELSAMRILTGGYPAEYGRKMGGVVELVTAREAVPGFHGKAVLQGGSFDTRSAFLQGQYAAGRAALDVSVQGALTDRFLDPPVEANFTNHGSSAGGSVRFQYDFGGRDRLRFYAHSKRTGFQVPNEWLQQQAGQRQDRTAEETMGQAAYQRVFSPRWLLDVRGMARTVGARLWSNRLSTPVEAEQDRGFREGYLAAGVSTAQGRHSLKFGAETALTRVREQFAYRITSLEFLEDDEPEPPAAFRFSGRKSGREHSAYAQDLVRLGRLTLNLGLRWDGYSLLVKEQFLSPRLGAAWRLPRAALVLRASYDRAVTIPAIENLLLAGSVEAQRLAQWTTGLPLRPSRGHFYEIGFSKALPGGLRLDGSRYRRDLRNFADDDVFLNTGVSFPIAFDRARIEGVEARLELPRWRTLSGFVSWSNLVGTGTLPVTGGLFLERDAAALLASTARFPISQDQRNTVQARFRWELHPRLWAALGAWHNSGLPVEHEGDWEELDEAYGERVVSRVNFARGRVRPSHALDLSLGTALWRGEGRTAVLQADLLNLANRLNLVNFAGLFSGTALGAPRTVQVRFRLSF